MRSGRIDLPVATLANEREFDHAEALAPIVAHHRRLAMHEATLIIYIGQVVEA